MGKCLLSLSYGKDSLACLYAIRRLGWPLDEIWHVEVWATDKIPADLPEMIAFKAKANNVIREMTGLDVKTVRGESFESLFHKKKGVKSKYPGEYLGFPLVVPGKGRGSWCVSALKTDHLKKMEKHAQAVYVGIAKDEPQRLARLVHPKISPLAAAGMTEKDCFDWCKKTGLLSPIYTNSTRGGCWFCPKQSLKQLRFLRKNYLEYWRLLLEWDKKSPKAFRADGKTVHDLDLRFAEEERFLFLPGLT